VIRKERQAEGTGVNRRKKPTLWSRFVLEKLIFAYLLRKFPTFYGTPRLITVYTTARYLSLT
jgi:hypothetical protein